MKRLLLLTLSLLTPAAAGWQSAAIPDNPAGQQLAKTMAAIASDSGADVAAFVKTFSASLLAVVPLAEQMKTFEQLHDEYGALSVVRIEASDAHSIVAALAPKGSPARLRVRLTTDPVAPNAIRTLTFEKLQAAAGDHASALERARNAFAEGRFDEASSGYDAVLKVDPSNAEAAAELGHLALMSNRFNAAEKHLRRAIELDSGSRKAKGYLGETLYRQDKFSEAARWFHEAGDEPIAKQLDTFQTAPYRIEGSGGMTAIKFVATDPLPVVEVTIDDSGPLNFVIDTGGAQVSLRPDVAQRLHVEGIATESGTFAAGRKAEISLGRVKKLTLGDFVVREIPVNFGGLQQGLKIAGREIDGVLGTVLLYHFVPTIDYPGGQLVLRRKTEAASAREGQIAVPFWMDGDHFMVAWGRVNDRPPVLMFLDTGFAGGGFLCPDSTLKDAGIIPAEAPGAGMKPRFVVSSLTLGAASAKDIRGIVGVFPPAMERSHGFRIGGLISHQFFRPYRLTFDFAAMKVYLERPSTSGGRKPG